MSSCGCGRLCQCLLATDGIGLNSVGAASGTPSNPYVVGLKPGIGGLVPHVKTGQWHRLAHEGSVLASTPVATNRAYAIPFQPGLRASGNHSLNGVAIEQTTPVLAGGNWRCGIYVGSVSADPTNAALISDESFNDVGGDATGPGIKQWITSTSVAPYEVVWIVIVGTFLAAGATARSVANNAAGVAQLATPTTLNDNMTAYFQDGFPAGAMPASFGAVTGTTQGPVVSVLLN